MSIITFALLCSDWLICRCPGQFLAFYSDTKPLARQEVLLSWKEISFFCTVELTLLTFWNAFTPDKKCNIRQSIKKMTEKTKRKYYGSNFYLQCEDLKAPTAAVEVPEVQGKHRSFPTSDWYVPCGHAKHLPPLKNEPTGHTTKGDRGGVELKKPHC